MLKSEAGSKVSSSRFKVGEGSQSHHRGGYYRLPTLTNSGLATAGDWGPEAPKPYRCSWNRSQQRKQRSECRAKTQLWYADEYSLLKAWHVTKSVFSALSYF